jgi:TrmH family RNA methyltransferase
MLSKSQVKYIQSLGHKKFRDEEGVFIAEGPKIVKEIINEIPSSVISIFALESWVVANGSLVRNIKPETISENELERISQLTAPNNVLALVRKFPEPLIETKDKLTLVLDTIQDPGNMGTIIRTADWFSVDQVVCSHDSADIFNPKVVQATMGSIARVKTLYTDLDQWLRQQPVIIYAASLSGKDIVEINRPSEGIIIIGNESKGIHPQLLLLAGEKITIAKKGKAESLNAAVATGIILSHFT